METEKSFLSVGELARTAGVTVRALQYYDKTGLLKSTFTRGGRRVYTREDILKFQQILFLKSFGFSLEAIKEQISTPNSAANLEKTFTRQREILVHQINHLQQIVSALNTAITEAKAGKELNLEKLMTIMELMKQGNPYTLVLRYFSDQQFQRADGT